jgi:hypothetical protein
MADRIRCPCCGHVVSRQRFNQDYKFEVLVVSSEGYRRIKWTKPEVKGIEILKRALLHKLKRIVQNLEAELLGFEKTERSVLTMSASLSSKTPMELWRSPTTRINAPATRLTIQSSRQSFQVPLAVKGLDLK